MNLVNLEVRSAKTLTDKSMTEMHEINRLIFHIDNTSEVSSNSRLTTIIQGVIEEYFDRFDKLGVDVFFDRIELDLGEIDQEHFETELNVRLRYLLEDELPKFFSQQDINAEIKTRSNLATKALFEEYLRLGINSQNDQSLSSVFANFAAEDAESLDQILDSSESWPIIRQRLFDQIDFSSYESYWTSAKASIYMPIRRINQQILKDFSERSMPDYGFVGLQGVLKRATYDFMFSADHSISNFRSYIHILRKQKATFDRYAHRISGSIDQYLYELEQGISLQNGLTASLSEGVSLSTAAHGEQILLKFLIEGRSPSALDINAIQTFSHTLHRSKLELISKLLISGVNESELLERLLRIHRVFIPWQLRVLYTQLSAVLSGKSWQYIAYIAKLDTIIEKEFGENLFSLSPNSFREYFRLGTSANRQGTQLIIDISKYISARQGIAPQKVTERISSIVQRSKGEEYKTIQFSIKEAMSSIKDSDTTRQGLDRPDWSLLSVFVHFLETGLWIRSNSSPQEVLPELLESNLSGISSAVYERLEDRILWIRLIHQFRLENVYILFKSIFGLDEHYPNLMVAVMKAQRAGSLAIERELLVAFTEAKIRTKALKETPFKGNIELEFSQLLEPLTEQNRGREHIQNLDYRVVLAQWLDQSHDLPDDDVRDKVLRSALSQIDIILDWLKTTSISAKVWQSIFSGLENKLLIDMMDKLNTIIVIESLDSFIDMIRLSRFGKVITQEKLVSFLIMIAHGESDQLMKSAKKEWKSFIKSHPEEAIGAKKQFRNSAQLALMGTTSRSDNLDDFLYHLDRVIQTGHFEAFTDFESFNVFEQKLRQLFEFNEPKFVRIFKNASTPKVMQLLARLEHATLSALKIAIDSKFKQSTYLEIVFSIRTNNSNNREFIDRVILAYGLKSIQFDNQTFLQFLNTYLPGLKLPVIDVNKTIHYDESIVHASIHFLKFGQFIDDRLSSDKLERIIIWILQNQRDLFISALTRDANLKLVLIRIYDTIQKSEWSYITSLILNRSQDAIEQEISRLENTTKKVKQPLAKMVAVELKSQSASDLLNYVTDRIETPSYTETEIQSIKKLEERLPQDFDILTSELPEKLLGMAIHPQFKKDYQVFQLIDNIAENGAFPSWSALKDATDFEDVLKSLHKSAPRLTQHYLDVLFREKQATLRLLYVLGTDRFLNVLKLLWKDSVLRMESVIRSLIIIHESLGKKEALQAYFVERYIDIYWPIKSDNILYVTRLIQAGIPADFNLSIDEYSKLLALKSLDQSDKQALSFISAFLSTRNLQQASVSEIRPQRTSDILKYLIVENEVPWWVDYSKIGSKTLQDQINEFSLKVLSEDPTKWIHDFVQSGHVLNIFSHLVKHINNQQFDRIILALNPNFGGFIVSFNMLFSRVSSSYSEDEWRLFVLEYVLKVKNINAANFIKDAFTSISQSTSINAEVLKLELQRAASAAVESGEIRFRPLVEMLEAPFEVEESILTFDDEQNETKSFDSILIHYLRFGTIPMGVYPNFNTYFEFSQNLQRAFLQNQAHIRSLIQADLNDSRVRARIIRLESDHFIAALISMLFPMTRLTLAKEGKSIRNFISDLIGLKNAKVIHDLFYATLLEQALSAHSKSLSTSDLLEQFIKKAVDQFQLKNIKKDVSIQIYEMSPTLREFVERTLFAGKSKLKLRGKDNEKTSPIESERTKFNEEGGELELKKADGVENQGKQVEGQEATADQTEKQKKEEEKELNEELEDVPHVELDFEVNLKNAGLVIIWPYLERYFELLEMVSNKKFKSKKAARRAVQLLQHLVTGLDSAPEHELLLNKVLCGVEIATPIPFEIELSDQERDVSEQMLNGLLHNWPRLKNTSIEALREGFLVRDGRLIETDEVWQLKVEDKTLDILMDGMPWSFGMIKLPWMNKRLNVEWR
ncbi:contractile injection system tape measure protein [bacterium]|nr:contractile injection system tape measure protein [bacterium]